MGRPCFLKKFILWRRPVSDSAPARRVFWKFQSVALHKKRHACICPSTDGYEAASCILGSKSLTRGW
jgi:hypothetical protein